MGKRVNLADLDPAESTAAPLPSMGDAPQRLRSVPPSTVAVNPINPRKGLGDLSDLESMRDGQLQPCVVVTRRAFLAVYPEHEPALGSCAFVVVAGSRRRAAAERFGLATLDIVVRDHLVATRAAFYGAAVTENLDRLALTPLEEAEAVEHLVAECGTARGAAEVLRKTPGWVSQRRALLKLSPVMKELLRSGELKIADARKFAALPVDEQEPTWRLDQRATPPPPFPSGKVPPAVYPASGDQAPPPARLQLPLDLSGAEMAARLRGALSPAQLDELTDALTT